MHFLFYFRLTRLVLLQMRKLRLEDSQVLVQGLPSFRIGRRPERQSRLDDSLLGLNSQMHPQRRTS